MSFTPFYTKKTTCSFNRSTATSTFSSSLFDQYFTIAGSKFSSKYIVAEAQYGSSAGYDSTRLKLRDVSQYVFTGYNDTGYFSTGTVSSSASYTSGSVTGSYGNTFSNLNGKRVVIIATGAGGGGSSGSVWFGSSKYGSGGGGGGSAIISGLCITRSLRIHGTIGTCTGDGNTGAKGLDGSSTTIYGHIYHNNTNYTNNGFRLIGYGGSGGAAFNQTGNASSGGAGGSASVSTNVAYTLNPFYIYNTLTCSGTTMGNSVSATIEIPYSSTLSSITYYQSTTLSMSKSTTSTGANAGGCSLIGSGRPVHSSAANGLNGYAYGGGGSGGYGHNGLSSKGGIGGFQIHVA